MKKDSNAFIKMLIVLVIASLALLAIVYFMLWAEKNSNQTPIAGPGMEKEKNETSENFFDKKGRLVVNEDIMMTDDYFTELCEGSAWEIGKEMDIWYHNKKHNYKLKIPYTEFYNDDLIVYPFLTQEGFDLQDRFDYNTTVSQDAEGNYSFPCGPHGPTPGIAVIVEETLSAEELRDETKPKFEKLKIGEWDAVSYVTAGYMQVVHIILLGEEDNYHFQISFEDNKEKLIDIIENDFILVK